MIGQTILRKVVGADLLGAIAAADHAAPLVANAVGLLLLLDVEQAATQHLHGFGAVLQLAALVLAFDDHTGRQMRDLHGAVRGVHALTAGTAGSRDVDLQVLLVDGDVDLFGLRQDRHRRGGGVDATLRFRGGHALHAVHAALVLEAGEHALTGHQRDHFFDAAGGSV